MTLLLMLLLISGATAVRAGTPDPPHAAGEGSAGGDRDTTQSAMRSRRTKALRRREAVGSA